MCGFKLYWTLTILTSTSSNAESKASAITAGIKSIIQ